VPLVSVGHIIVCGFPNPSSPEPGPVVPPIRTGHRRQFSQADKQRILAETDGPGRSLSEVARQFVIAKRVVFRWRKELAAEAVHRIGETTSKVLDYIPARLRVLRIRRPKYGCRSCGTIHQAPTPERPIAKGLASPGLLAHVLISKYCDHTPLYRQSQIFARHGVELGRSTLANWVGGTTWWLEPLRARMADHVFASEKLFADDTTIPVLDPGRGQNRDRSSSWTRRAANDPISRTSARC
jgi:transposase